MSPESRLPARSVLLPSAEVSTGHPHPLVDGVARSNQASLLELCSLFNIFYHKKSGTVNSTENTVPLLLFSNFHGRTNEIIIVSDNFLLCKTGAYFCKYLSVIVVTAQLHSFIYRHPQIIVYLVLLHYN